MWLIFLINIVVDDFSNDANPDRVELEKRQRAVNEGRVGSRLPQVGSDDDFVVATKIAALLRRFPYSKYCFCTHGEGWYKLGDARVWLSICMLNVSVSFKFDAYW